MAGTVGCSAGALESTPAVSHPLLSSSGRAEHTSVLPGSGDAASLSTLAYSVPDASHDARELPSLGRDLSVAKDDGGRSPKETAPLPMRPTPASTRAAKVAPEDPKEPVAELPTGPRVAPVRLDVPEDHPVIVYPAPAGQRRVILYLHGHCGSVEKIDSWAPEVSKLGTVIALLGNWGCDGAPGRFRWGMSIRYLNKRILRAVRAVGATRPDGLDDERITVIGYSQGAEKAEQLPRWYPERYPWIVLAGPPTAPHPWRLAPAAAVVVIAGENENQAHIRRGFRNLQFAGELAAFMELPDAAHGEFGPEGARVLSQALWWLYDRAPEPVAQRECGPAAPCASRQADGAAP
jgi:pimeloyl-ACP methyl ester carboxylesterase